MGAMTEAERLRDDRLRWHCRRALLELDIVFSRFWALQGNAALPATEAESLEALLALDDYMLWDLVSGRQPATAWPPAAQGLIERLQQL